MFCELASSILGRPLLPPVCANLTSQVVKTPKYYWAVLGLLRHLSGQFSATTRELFETYVVGEMNKWVKSSGANMRLFSIGRVRGLNATCWWRQSRD